MLAMNLGSKSSATLLYGTLSFAAAALVGCAGHVATTDSSGQASLADSSKCPPAPPSPALAVPDGNSLAMSFDAVGVQIYACTAVGTGFAWVFQAPEANLYNDGGELAATHFLTTGPITGPTWQAVDGSQVIGAKIGAFAVDPTAIPWLLLRAVSNVGDGRMAKVTFIQRFETTGGKAPASGCDGTTVGNIARVDYTATYYFYQEKDGNDEPSTCQ